MLPIFCYKVINRCHKEMNPIISRIFEEAIFITALVGMLGVLTVPITMYQLWLNLPVQILDCPA
jgi:hypothetical protein